ncbi:Fic family protein [Candidatus Saccharibacteria bacterium]|nr:Fic family protein [Candidatus Saccharibacteria bacterium]
MKTYQSGVLRRANADTGYEYQYFLPSFIPTKYQPRDPTLARLLEEATHSLGELNAYARFVPDIDFFIRMHETKEATASNKIEGTKTNIGEAVMREEDIAPERRDDWREVQNYIKAMGYAIVQLDEMPLIMRLLGETHKILLSGVRGAGKQPGTTRQSQNWIGGATLKDARFVPPHHYHVPELLSDLEKFLNKDNLNMPLLMKAGIAHYQFETIHPYLDGNGRLGRLLIILYLMQQGMLDKPVLYLSQFFEAHRQEYYEALNIVRTHSDLEQWLKFFFVGVSETAKGAVATLQAVMQLRAEDNVKVLGLGRRAKRASDLVERLYKDPIISVNQAAQLLNVTPQAANALVRELVRIGILSEITGTQRNRLFAYQAYLALFADNK